MSLLQGRYRREAVLRQGEAATTSLALDTSTGQLCVVKSLELPSQDALKLLELLERLQRQARAYGKLSHPRIPKLLEAFPLEEEGRTSFVLVTEYVEGRDLARVVREGGPYAEARALALLRSLSELLDRLHGHTPRLTHGSVRPEKVIVDPTGEPHLVDFGSWSRAMRRLLGPEGARSPDDGRGYAAPEGVVGPASDVYSLGATVAFALTGRDPAERGTARLRVPWKLRRVLAGMQAAKVEERYADAGAVLRALDEPSPASGLFDRRAGIAAAATFAFAAFLLTRPPPRAAPQATLVSAEPAPSATPAEARESPASPRPSPRVRASARPQQVTESRPRDSTRVAATPAPEPRPPVDVAPPPVWPGDGLLSIDIYRDFKYVAAGWPGGLAPGQTNATPLDTRPQERLYAEPRYASPTVFYGCLRLGNGPDSLVSFVLDELERPTWVAWVDKNNNQDLTDDGPPLAHQGSGLHFAANVSLEVEVQSPGSRPERRPYKIWLWVNELESGPAGPSRYVARFYAVCHYAGRVELFGEVFDAVAFEERGHDALFGEDGVWIDLDRNGKFERPAEHFLDGEEVRTGRGWWRLRIGHP